MIQDRNNRKHYYKEESKKILQLAVMLAAQFAYCDYIKWFKVKKGAAFLLIPFSLLLLVSCASHKQQKKYRIGFSQCANDVWRQNMQIEMEREFSFHPEVDLLIKNANLSSKKQIEQIHELLAEKIDLLIVSPNEAQPLTPTIDKVYKDGLPVIVVDRNILSKNYTAFIGASN